MKFSSLPIPENIQGSLDNLGYTKMTKVQSLVIPKALDRNDIIVVAKTGSGKTLAFLIPIILHLSNIGWSNEDGTGAIIIVPTRELALQITTVLNSLNSEYSSQLAVGKNSLEYERKVIPSSSIIIGTPGRLLQHMDQTSTWILDNLQLLIMDEADQIMDMGFYGTINAILDHLPKTKQVMLFSATSIIGNSHELDRLHLKTPEIITLGRSDPKKTPKPSKNISQFYMYCKVEEKPNILYSFIMSHLKKKMIVFMSTCKQATFYWTAFSRIIKEGKISFICLHGHQRQWKRFETLERFHKMKVGVLFTTDLASRGLDIKGVDWVIQVDSPDTIETYVHRIGRTARYKSKGRALLLLMEEESGLLDKIEGRIEKAEPKENETKDIMEDLRQLCNRDKQIRLLAKSAFISYVKALIHYLGRETVEKIGPERYRKSLGLLSYEE